MVGVAQLAEHRVVIPVVAGSTPVTHPTEPRSGAVPAPDRAPPGAPFSRSWQNPAVRLRWQNNSRHRPASRRRRERLVPHAYQDPSVLTRFTLRRAWRERQRDCATPCPVRSAAVAEPISHGEIAGLLDNGWPALTLGSTYPSTMRAWVVRSVLLLLVMLPVLLYVVAERSCPPPSWAFWRSGNFACV
jgi:hypothetical protein